MSSWQLPGSGLGWVFYTFFAKNFSHLSPYFRAEVKEASLLEWGNTFLTRGGDSTALSRFLTIKFLTAKGSKNGQAPPSFTPASSASLKIPMEWLQVAEANSISAFWAAKLLLFREVLRAGVNGCIQSSSRRNQPLEADTPHPRQGCANAAQPTLPGTSKMLRAGMRPKDATWI